MYNFELFYEDCKNNFSSFDEFAEECEKLDKCCAVDWDAQTALFYDFAFPFDSRTKTIKSFLNCAADFDKMAERQIEVQREFRRCMSAFF